MARQSDMKAMVASAKTIGDMFKETKDYESSGFRVAAETIRQKSGSTLSGHFGNGPVPFGSQANLNIMAERERFDILSNDLAVYAKALVTAAERNQRDNDKTGNHLHCANRNGARPLDLTSVGSLICCFGRNSSAATQRTRIQTSHQW
ncbi:cytochrome c [Pararhizobium sp. BT-229]|uniref:cytochrome c n=1 Tax=Pararhizobium sp. BT-229 TaxID=2986923 RepID=UPI0021F7F40A|nr:cytochrome c [Pararhizobium sp. BT-229]MCV9960323.1 cytochrome c [Pararhizobium sp. BT-229]